MPQVRSPYHCVAGVESNNLPQTDLESVKWSWINQPSRKVPPVCSLRPPPLKRAKSWVLIPPGCTIYRCVDGVKPNNLPQTELESVEWPWRNHPTSKLPRACSLRTPSTVDCEILSFEATGMHFMPAYSWR